MGRLLITGARGNVGREVLALLEAAGADIRVASRSATLGPPTSADAVRFDFTDASTWPATFDGVDAMFLVRLPTLGNVQRDLLPALAAARAAGVRHSVFLSLQGAEKIPVVPHATVERWLCASGLAWTFVRASFFHQNLSTTHAADIRDRDAIIVPAGRGATAFVDAVDVGAVAAAALLDPGAHRGKAWTVTGPRAYRYDEIADILTRELGRPIHYTRPGIVRYLWHARATLRMSWGMAFVTAAIYTSARLGLAAGLSDSVRVILGRNPISFAEFAHRERDAWIPVRGH